jgi:ketosteroid isomerase-like protein
MNAAADLVRRAYQAFNARDLDAALALMAPDVDWPNAWEGGRVVGHDAVHDYWTRQWAEIDPHVDPVGVRVLPDGRIAVDVHQIVRSRAGELLADSRVEHVYTVRDGLIVRMEVFEGAS